MRPAEVDLLIADPSKAREQLGWEPQNRFDELVRLMVDADLEGLRSGVSVETAWSPGRWDQAAMQIALDLQGAQFNWQRASIATRRQLRGLSSWPPIRSPMSG